MRVLLFVAVALISLNAAHSFEEFIMYMVGIPFAVTIMFMSIVAMLSIITNAFSKDKP